MIPLLKFNVAVGSTVMGQERCAERSHGRGNEASRIQLPPVRPAESTNANWWVAGFFAESDAKEFGMRSGASPRAVKAMPRGVARGVYPGALMRKLQSPPAAEARLGTTMSCEIDDEPRVSTTADPRTARPKSTSLPEPLPRSVRAADPARFEPTVACERDTPDASR